MHAFISHITEESSIAICLKDWIESSLLGNCSVFVSSDSEAIPAGFKWLDKINDALQTTQVMFVLCSSQSLQRPWINFEMGYAWSRNIPVIPLCHSGISKSSLPRPVGDFQALNIDDSNFVNLLLESLKTHFKLPKIPRIDAVKMQIELLNAINTVKQTDMTSVKTQQNSTENLDKKLFSGEGIKILHYLGQQDKKLSPEQIANYFRRSTQQTKYHLDELKKLGLIIDFINMITGITYSISSEGRKFLFERNML